MDATLVLRCLSEPESKADLRSVKISELAQKLTEIATFFSRKEEKIFRFLDFGAISFEYSRERRNENLEGMSKWTRLCQ